VEEEVVFLTAVTKKTRTKGSGNLETGPGKTTNRAFAGMARPQASIPKIQSVLESGTKIVFSHLAIELRLPIQPLWGATSGPFRCRGLLLAEIPAIA
jgi:hypothetical protein